MFKIPKLSSTGRHNLESNRKKGKIRKSGILGGENPQEVCFNMVRQGVVSTRRLTSEDWDSPASNTSTIQKLIRVRYKHS